jgi:Tfp pilus assembly protein PilN
MRAVNLIPDAQRQGSGSFTGRSGGGALILLGVLAGLAALIAVYGSAHHQISSQAGEVARLDAQTSAVEARTGKLAAYTSFVTMVDQRNTTVSQLVAARFDWSHTLHELGRVLPAGTALSSLHGTIGATASASGSAASAPAATSGATPVSSTPPGSTPVFSLTGCAKDQSVVAQTLQRLRLMDGASEVQLQSSTTGGGSGSSSGSAGSGGCPGDSATFSVQVVFAALPSPPASGAPAPGTSATAAAQTSASVKPVSTQEAGGSK